MPGFLLHKGATIKCAHNGTVEATAPVTNVLVDGKPIVVKPVPHGVTACTFNVSGSPQPCITARWNTAATRIKSYGNPVLLKDSQATCDPNNTPVVITVTQTRVKGI